MLRARKAETLKHETPPRAEHKGTKTEILKRKTPRGLGAQKREKNAKKSVDSEVRNYELVIVVSAAVKAEKRKEVVLSLERIIESLGGKNVKTTEWGLKDLAYPIAKQLSGWYALMNLSLPAEAAPKLAEAVKREERIIRYLLIKQNSKSEIRNSKQSN